MPNSAAARRGEPDNAANAHSHSHQRGSERGFQEVPLYPVGCQNGRDRFPQRFPRINPYRNNLTACSQLRNLYFLACIDWIYVYKPQYPHQFLPYDHELAWQLPVSKPGLTGYFPLEPFHEQSPHSINNVLVATLGSIEVLICACDDGDVIAYYTHTLLGGGCTSADHSSHLPHHGIPDRTPKAFFHQNVGMSAWGLAVHAEARLIAVSSNNHEITVFAPALHDPAQDHCDNTSGPSTKKLLLRHRTVSRRRSLRGHFANIPSISFCNTSDDTEGLYLASTDIRGSTFIWNVNMATRVRMLEPLRHGSDTGLSDADPYDAARAGWGVMFLDKNCFSRTKSIVQAMGTCYLMKHALNAKSPQNTLRMYNISESRATVRNSGDWMDPRKLRRPVHRTDSLSQPLSNSSGPYLEVSDDDMDEEEDEEAPNVVGHNTRNTNRDFVPLNFKRTAYNGGISTLVQNKVGTIPEDQIGPGISQQDLIGHKLTIFSHRAVRIPSVPKSSLPKTPLLLLNPRKTHLFQSADFSLRDDDSNDPQPVIYLEDPLAQQVPPQLAMHFQHLDRMNLYTHIPELGIVLAGSPKGRVAVLTLHLLEPNIDPTTGMRLTDVAEPMFTIRLDHILPLKEQEDKYERPLQPLVGVAASPVFGIEERRKRYRVFLTYLNHTVLTYEIGREGTDYMGLGDVFAI